MAMRRSGRCWRRCWRKWRPGTCGWPTEISARRVFCSGSPSGAGTSSFASTLRRCVGREKAPGGWWGRTATGTLYEQRLWLENEAGDTLPVRRVTLVLKPATRDGETEIHRWTNLPARVAPARRAAELYRGRWTSEGLFQDLTTILRCAVNTLAYPKAARFGFCVALASSNVYATVQASLRAVPGVEKVEREVSDDYLGAEISGKYEGMMIAIPERYWRPFGECAVAQVATRLCGRARNAHLARFQKQPRGPKKPHPRRTRFAKAKHISTARLRASEKRLK